MIPKKIANVKLFFKIFFFKKKKKIEKTENSEKTEKTNITSFSLNGTEIICKAKGDVKGYFIRGAIRANDISYPDRQWGYGKLDVYNSFEVIRG